MPAISTHTLTWSVTRNYTVVECDKCNFNSHAHVERDRTRSHLSAQSKHFNSHAHVERDCRQGKNNP